LLDPNVALRFADNQKRLLRKLYDDAWRQGVDSYEPDDDPEEEPRTPRDEATAGLTGTALLLARRRYGYQPPRHPDPVRRAVAMAPAFRGVNKMVSELSALAAGSAPEVVDAGGDVNSALEQWVQSNGDRLMLGESVAWAGEQAGFAEAADADGQFLYSWSAVNDSTTCPDCELLSGFPPMPLQDWPTAPGAGDTSCSAGCRCAWDTWGMNVDPNYSPDLTQAQSDLITTLSDRQAQALADLMPDVAYLE